jgi:hypothetical protein
MCIAANGALGSANDAGKNASFMEETSEFLAWRADVVAHSASNSPISLGLLGR